MASSAKRAFEPTTLRSLFIKVKPAPRRLSERRAILRTLQQYGEIEVFQALTDPGAFNAVATKAITVQHLMVNSPLQFDYVPEQPSNTDPSTGGVPKDIHSLHQAMGASSDTQSFTLNIFPSDTEHRHQIQKSPLYGPWPTNNPCGPVKSFATEALKQVIPNDMAAKGLRDWETGGQTLKKLDKGRAVKSGLVGDIVERRVARRKDREDKEGKRSEGNLLETFTE